MQDRRDPAFARKKRRKKEGKKKAGRTLVFDNYSWRFWLKLFIRNFKISKVFEKPPGTPSLPVPFQVSGSSYVISRNFPYFKIGDLDSREIRKRVRDALDSVFGFLSDEKLKIYPFLKGTIRKYVGNIRVPCEFHQEDSECSKIASLGNCKSYAHR